MSDEKILETEFSEPFVQGMRDRMVVSYYKYGPIAKGYPEPISAVKSLTQRLGRYEATGNREFLMDVANFAMIEFMRPSHPLAHFQPTDSDQSPGRVYTDGTRTQRNNAGGVVGKEAK